MFSPLALVRALLLVSRAWLPILALALLLLVPPYLLYRRDSYATDAHVALSTDFMIILEQMRRAAMVLSPDLVFIGDSSCLMGVHVPTIREHLPSLRVESLCTIGTVGPAGYAHILDRMVARGAAPKAIVIMLHPIQFQRHPSWEGTTRFVQDGGALPVRPSNPLIATIRFLQLQLSRVFFTPLPGNYGRYYGTEENFVGDIRETGGSAVDPGALSLRSLGELQAEVAKTKTVPQGTAQPYDINESFERALASLASSLRTFDHNMVYLLIAPVPNVNYYPSGYGVSARAEREIASRLGVPPDNVLPLGHAWPFEYFSSVTHANRWGRIMISRSLGQLLRTRLGGLAAREAAAHN
jgi:hypothetical protein